MKVVLISSSFEDQARNKTIEYNSHYPMGLGYLHSYLEQQNHTVHTLFLNDYPYKNCRNICLNYIDKNTPDVIGLNIITQNRTSSFRLIKILHKLYPRVHIMIGGIHTTIMYKQILRRFPYIVAVIGEGEITAKELLEKMQNKKSIHTVNGIAYMSKGKIIKTNDRELIPDLDVLPFPKHDIFFTEQRTIASMITSRGCPFHCSFCVLNAITRSYPRKRSIQNVIHEIECLISHHPQLETIWFHDDQFFLINARVIEFCKEIIKRKIHLNFICSGRFKPVSKEMVTWMEKAGFIQVLLGLESGSPKILNLCHKNITHEDVIRTVKLFKQTRILLTAFLIIGLYGETKDTINETIGFVQKIQRIKYFYFDNIGILIIYPGTEVYDIAKKAHVISDLYWLTEKTTPLFTVEHSKQKLLYFKNRVQDGISLKRIFTYSGFIHQYYMIPWIIKFLILNIPMYPLYIRLIIQRFFPHIYTRMRNILYPKAPHLNPSVGYIPK